MVVIAVHDLTLRPVQLGDARRFADLCNDIDIARNTARIKTPYDINDAAAFLRCAINAARAGDEHVFAVCRDGDIIACASASRRPPGYELGYWVGRDYRRQGVATLAAKAILEFIFQTLDAPEASAGYFTDNPASGRVLAALGFEPAGPPILTASAGRGCDVETARLRLLRRKHQSCADIVITPLAD